MDQIEQDGPSQSQRSTTQVCLQDQDVQEDLSEYIKDHEKRIQKLEKVVATS